MQLPSPVILTSYRYLNPAFNIIVQCRNTKEVLKTNDLNNKTPILWNVSVNLGYGHPLYSQLSCLPPDEIAQFVDKQRLLGDYKLQVYRMADTRMLFVESDGKLRKQTTHTLKWQISLQDRALSAYDDFNSPEMLPTRTQIEQLYIELMMQLAHRK
jgi:hypothetical protein